MERAKFLELQFQTLRKEIEDTKGRIFKLEVGGIGIPILPIIVQLFSDVISKPELPKEIANTRLSVENFVALITTVAPLFIIVLIIAFVAEKSTLMRCGKYIQCHIEPFIPSVTGWETWLDADRRQRDSDRFVVRSFTSLWVGYYAFTSLLASLYLPTDHSWVVAVSSFLNAHLYPLEIWHQAFCIYSVIGFFIWLCYHRTITTLYNNRKADDFTLWVLAIDTP